MNEKARNIHLRMTRVDRGFAGLIASFSLFFLVIFLSSCTELKPPKSESILTVTPPPPAQELRWSNGSQFKNIDPVKASAPPETDIVRAVYEGLTDIDPKTLEARPAAADTWTADEDNKIWTFHLREGLKWSNGETLNANDFVRSWTRLAENGDSVAHSDLLKNIVGFEEIVSKAKSEKDAASKKAAEILNADADAKPDPIPSPTLELPPPPRRPDDRTEPVEPKIQLSGVEAIDDDTLKISLIHPDKDLPKLIANPIFMPIYGDGKIFDNEKIDASTVTNGPFRITDASPETITLERSGTYWDRDNIKLDRVHFVSAENAEAALNAYQSGAVDVVTNATFEPLALKLFAPFDDLKPTTHGAINFYEVNVKSEPFNDRRVREALAISIERERLTEGELEGTTQPAHSFLPFEPKEAKTIVQDTAKARSLLADAGYPEGKNFPAIRLVINRNDVQIRIAKLVAKMWKQNLNVETDIIVKEAEELATIRDLGDYDLLRRGTVLPTSDEFANFISIFGYEAIAPAAETENGVTKPIERGPSDVGIIPELGSKPIMSADTTPTAANDGQILNEAEALYQLHGIPLYFPISYSLVKPYVRGFNVNSLDAPSLKDVTIDSNWQPKAANVESK